MSAALHVRAMAAVLGQARVPAVISTLLAAASLWSLVLTPHVGGSAGVLLLSLLAGLVQAGFAVRIGFDRALLEALLIEHPDADPAPIDAALHALGLRAPPAQTRPWSARWQGMRRLLRGQLLSVLVQALLLMLALWLRSRA